MHKGIALQSGSKLILPPLHDLDAVAFGIVEKTDAQSFDMF
jgi:hypothetical protein